VTVAIVTPWHNHPDLYPDYEEAVYAGAPDEILIVDNASDPRLEFGTIRAQENLGFCGGSNLGLQLAVSDIVCFLNNDIAIGRADHWWLEAITSKVEPGVLVGTRLRTDRHAWVDGQVMPYLDGWCLAGLRDELVELGGFDSTLEEPGYFSDNLLCLEARAAGFTLREAPVGILHKGGRTSRPAENPEVGEVSTRNWQRYQERAREVLAAVA
jgi:GT2 family glycosyltransferase